MKAAFFKRAVILSAAFLICGSPLFAETQSVTVTGSLDSYWIYRRNFDLRDGNDSGMSPAGLQIAGAGGGGLVRNQSEGDNFFMSVAQIEIAANLTERVSLVINLINQRDWNADAFNTSIGGDVAVAAENREEEFDVALDLAYAEMREIFYAPLTLRFGRQDLHFGRGFVLGANYQDPDNSIAADEFTAVTSFDAIRATLDFRPWTLDFVFAQIDENNHDPEADLEFWFANVNYQFSEYDAEWEGYLLVNPRKFPLAPGPAGAADRPRTAADFLIEKVGTRVQFDPVRQITLGAEGALERGNFYSLTTDVKRDRDGWALDFFAEYRWEGEWKPAAGVEYVAMSGDNAKASTEDFEDWTRLFASTVYGDIRQWQGVFYEVANFGIAPASVNQEHICLYGSIEPMGDLRIEGRFYWFWLEQEIFVDSATSTLSRHVGEEFDVHVVYDYTEDVSFILMLGWFMPGELFDHPVQGELPGSIGADAFQAISGVKVHF